MAGPGEIVVAPDAALTCATDAKMLRVGAHPALGPLPAPLGHELAGTVVEVGAGRGGGARRRRGRGRQLRALRALPRLRRGEGEPVSADRVPHRRVRRARAGSRADRGPQRAAPPRRARPRAGGRDGAPGVRRPRRGPPGSGGGRHGARARRRRAGAAPGRPPRAARGAGWSWPTRTPGGASAPSASGPSAPMPAPRDAGDVARLREELPGGRGADAGDRGRGAPRDVAHRRGPRAPRGRGAAARRVRGGQRGDAPHGPPALRGAHPSRLLSPHARGGAAGAGDARGRRAAGGRAGGRAHRARRGGRGAGGASRAPSAPSAPDARTVARPHYMFLFTQLRRRSTCSACSRSVGQLLLLLAHDGRELLDRLARPGQRRVGVARAATRSAPAGAARRRAAPAACAAGGRRRACGPPGSSWRRRCPRGGRTSPTGAGRPACG